jgi:hypothetical protein
MNTTTLIILNSTTFGTPSGNYDGSSLDWYSDPVKAANYYRGQGPYQTVTIQVSNFEGDIKLQATLNEDPASLSWFDVYDFDSTSSILTDFRPITITGNFVWMRARIDNFTAGTIDQITITY